MNNQPTALDIVARLCVSKVRSPPFEIRHKILRIVKKNLNLNNECFVIILRLILQFVAKHGHSVS